VIFPLINETISWASTRQRSLPSKNAPPTSPHARWAKDDPLLLKNLPDPGGRKVDLVACTAKKKAEIIAFAFAENELES
jgi:hypothetical protein